MTAKRPRASKPYAIRYDAEAVGTLLGALTWVMGGLAILKDRGHASGDEQFHELANALTPELERLVLELSSTRIAAGNDPAREAAVEAAYARVREAFETWVQVTAADTLQAALGHRLQHEDKPIG